MAQSYTFNSIKPPLVGSAHFKIRYRLLPSGSFTDYENVDTFPYTIEDLEDGSYEAEIIYVTPDAQECAPSYSFFNIVSPYTCGDFTALIVTSPTSLPYIGISYSVPSPLTSPPCGYIIDWMNNTTGAKGTTSFATIPVSPLKVYMTGTVNSNDSITVIIYANLCNGKTQICYQQDLTAPSPPCTPMSLTTVDLVYNGPTSTLPNSYFIRLLITNSNPTTPNYIVNYQETSNTNPYPPDKGTYNYKGAALAAPSVTLLFSFPVFPKTIFIPPFNQDNPNYGACIQYKGSITDACGVAHPFCVTHPVACLECS